MATRPYAPEDVLAREAAPPPSFSVVRLVAVPAFVTLAVTLLRVIGELQGWSGVWFSRTRGTSTIGITWLVPVFGIYFALKLKQLGQRPSSFARAFGYSLLGALVLVAAAFLPDLFGVEWEFYGRSLYSWLFFAVAAGVGWRGWPALWKTLVVYGYSARIPVVIVMFLAFQGNWDTPYDAVPADFPGMGVLPKFLWLGFFPQLILWVAFTVLVGMLCGTLVAGIARLREISV